MADDTEAREVMERLRAAAEQLDKRGVPYAAKDSDVVEVTAILDAHHLIARLLADLDASRRAEALAAATKDRALFDLATMTKRAEAAEQEVEILRQYGNKDCTRMADEALDAARAQGER